MSFIQHSDVKVLEPVPGYRGRFVHSDTMTFAYWEIEKDAPLPEHSHPHEQVATVMEGEYEFTIGGETQVLTPGMTAVVPSNVPHSGKALTFCKLLDVFHPIREEYR